MSRVFISYSNLDRARVEPYISGLEAAGFDVWWDKSLHAGDNWAEGIERELERADCIVIFWSQNSVNSPWVRIEAHTAKRKNRIVPVKLEAVELPDEYRALQTLSVVNQSETQFLQGLSHSIRDTTARNTRNGWVKVGAAVGITAIALFAVINLYPIGSTSITPQNLSTTPPLIAERPTRNSIPSLWSELNQASGPQQLDQLNRRVDQLLSVRPSDNEMNRGSLHTLACRISLRRYEIAHRDSDLALAESQCGKARELDPALELLEETEGWLALYTGELDKALSHFNKAIALKDRASSAYIGQAMVLENQGDAAAAEQAFSAAVVARPDYWRAHNELGVFLLRSGQLDAALKRLQLALDLSPDSNLILINIGVTQIFQGKYAAAISAWGRALDLTPAREHGPTFSNIGSAYYLLGDFNAAKVAFQKASRLGGDDYRTWGNLADAFRALGEEDQAMAYYRRALDRAKLMLASNAQDLHAAASAVTFRSALDEQGWESELASILKRGGNDAELHRLAALAYVRSKQPDQASVQVKQAIKFGYPAFFIADDYELATVKVP